jgi:hypothetical protein
MEEMLNLFKGPRITGSPFLRPPLPECKHSSGLTINQVALDSPKASINSTGLASLILKMEEMLNLFKGPRLTGSPFLMPALPECKHSSGPGIKKGHHRTGGDL